MNDIHFYPFQKDAIEKLRSGSILCGGVGTGKSITALGYFFLKEVCGTIKENGQAFPPVLSKDLYIITTARKRDTKEWEKECERFPLKNISVTIDSWNNIGKYEKVEGAFFIFDEQRVVGSGSWVKSFLRITKKNPWILLSATPGDTWMDYIPVFVANGFYKNRTEFLTRHALYNRYSKYPKVDRWLEVTRLELLRRKITVKMEFEKKTVPHDIDIRVLYDKTMYESVSKNMWNPFDEEPVRDISQACYLMRRVVNGDGSRISAMKDILTKHSKVIVFYNFDYELDILRESFSSAIPMAEWNGHKHEPIPKTDRWIYLVQYTAGCEGWNCTETDTVIFYSQSYSYKQMTQAAGRVDRMNTPFVDLYYYHLLSDASIDHGILRALKGKKNFNEKIFSEQMKFA